MTPEELAVKAIESAWGPREPDGDGNNGWYDPVLLESVAAAIEEEREACAKVAEDCVEAKAFLQIGDAIRARSRP